MYVHTECTTLLNRPGVILMYIEVELYYRGFRLKTLNEINNKIHYNQRVYDVMKLYCIYLLRNKYF